MKDEIKELKEKVKELEVMFLGFQKDVFKLQDTFEVMKDVIASMVEVSGGDEFIDKVTENLIKKSKGQVEEEDNIIKLNRKK